MKPIVIKNNQAAAEIMTECERLFYECLPSYKKEIEDIVKKIVKNKKEVKKTTNAIYKCKNKGIDPCRKYWSNPYEGENSVREYEENIKFCEENIRIIDDALSFKNSKKNIRELLEKKENFEKEIERWRKLIESKTVASKTDNFNNNGDVFANNGYAYGRNSKNNGNTKTKNTTITIAITVFIIIIISAVVFWAKHQKVENPSITNTTETSVEFEQKNEQQKSNILGIVNENIKKKCR